MRTLPLFSSLKVVELAGVLAGPAVGMFLAELGARVIKIENPKTGGDMTRHWRLPCEDPSYPESAYYCSVNWGKEVLFLDINEPKDRQRLDELLKDADIVISNFKPESARRMQLDGAAILKNNPGAIVAELSGFGADDGRPAFDVVLQAEAGFMYMNGEPGGVPVKMPVALIDVLAAHQMKEAMLIALLERQMTGNGAVVRVSLLEAALSALANQATNWLMAGHIPQPMGSAHPNIAPYGDVFYGKDGKALVLAIGTEGHFEKLCQILELKELLSDSRFATNVQRVAHREGLIAILAAAIAQYDRADLLEKLLANGIPAGSIRNMQEVFEMPTAQAMVLEEKTADGRITRRMRTLGFELVKPKSGEAQ
ncbi:MAG TPA: CoA transferase [Saprospiraceae bacterium]|nr:CoA transferase [Saprospiraceae bacterium]HMQ84442.1 CoA transferase [Saprospiraceae bacterium]